MAAPFAPWMWERSDAQPATRANEVPLTLSRPGELLARDAHDREQQRREVAK